MDSPLARVILATLGGYLTILLFWSVYDWYVGEYPQRPSGRPNSERIQHPFYHLEASRALNRFSRLSKTEKADLKGDLESSLISLEQWLRRLEQTKFQILCLGELHEESTRAFLAKEFFAKVRTDVFMLEATPRELKGLIKRREAGREYFTLLDADIMNILRTVRDRNPDIKIYGIEKTAQQTGNHQDHSNPRDQAIAQNFWVNFEPGLRHIILFGALHCTNEPNWLFHNLCDQASKTLKDEMVNVQIFGEHQNGPVEAFVYFIDEIGIEKRHFVIADTRSLPKYIYEWFPLLSRQALEKYRSLLVFRT